MKTNTVLAPLLGSLREEATADFYYPQAKPIPYWPARSDDLPQRQLEDELHHCLCRTGYAPLRHIGIENLDGYVVPIGRVPTYSLKPFAQTMAASFPELDQFQNDIEVTTVR